MRQIFTIDSRDNFFLDVMREMLNLSDGDMRAEIEAMHAELVRILAGKGLPYQKFKYALVPQSDRHEAGFIFDSRAVDSTWYGAAVARLYLPLLDKRVPQSVMHGDLLGADQDFIFRVLEKFMVRTRSFTFEHGSSLYCVYINNLSETALANLHRGLSQSRAYLGLIPATFQSLAKSYLSTTVGTAFVKIGDRVVMTNPDDDEEDVNILGYSFEEFGYRILSVPSMYFGPFLSYKIESGMSSAFPEDVRMSVNALHPDVTPLGEFAIEIDEAKFGYVQENKLDKLRTAGVERVTREELQALIAEKVAANYIYNLTLLPEHDVVKFNMMVELPRTDGGYAARLVASLEYMPEPKLFRLITLT